MIEIPAKLIRNHGEKSAEWLAGLPGAVAEYVDRWQLTVDGEPLSGEASLILPVVRRDGRQAMLKLQPFNDESEGEALALRTWNRDDVVEVLEDDYATSTLLLERLEPRTLDDLPDHVDATRILAEFLARLSAVPAPPGIRRLEDVAGAMVDDAPGLIPLLSDPAERRLVRRFVAQVEELLPDSGDRLLHWDLHYYNVMAAQRQPWLVIDPKPLAGDPGFEVFPVLWNRWDDLVATGDLRRAIRDRFDLMLEVTGIDRDRALGWTAGRILQNVLWFTADGATRIELELAAVADALFS
ncbi:streptomycin 6-kinase/streptomycin 6-kinase [Kribbella antiqua]|uniref:Streptomycin 6-kinase/streptomycin 6-kinase n=1 Tax=Kribbella antiqua TaxID=2512217 RepID=A0A4R2IQ36_9ACTN|nr:aminoglycoside phosphotransferase family protein [Kribbella antiqua]TCO46108.1 streptomycin 6-kinase/streptomycin 6-kinase [Kribbella antiqua]